ncbi:pectate lyase [Streptomyces scabiei]|uniref:pectate lyase n=1 Tax=Streptomyces TaxID=1883 RepID=UPI001BFFC40D|nr:pectate lyase [Streptomyces sp. ATCC 21386]
MSASAEQRVRHRRRVTGRRAVTASVAALAPHGRGEGRARGRQSGRGPGPDLRVRDSGRLVRSCGNCRTQHQRAIVLSDIDVVAPLTAIVGMIADHGDTATPTAPAGSRQGSVWARTRGHGRVRGRAGAGIHQ